MVRILVDKLVPKPARVGKEPEFSQPKTKGSGSKADRSMDIAPLFFLIFQINVFIDKYMDLSFYDLLAMLLLSFPFRKSP